MKKAKHHEPNLTGVRKWGSAMLLPQLVCNYVQKCGRCYAANSTCVYTRDKYKQDGQGNQSVSKKLQRLEGRTSGLTVLDKLGITSYDMAMNSQGAKEADTRARIDAFITHSGDLLEHEDADPILGAIEAICPGYVGLAADYLAATQIISHATENAINDSATADRSVRRSVREVGARVDATNMEFQSTSYDLRFLIKAGYSNDEYVKLARGISQRAMQEVLPSVMVEQFTPTVDSTIKDGEYEAERTKMAIEASVAAALDTIPPEERLDFLSRCVIFEGDIGYDDTAQSAKAHSILAKSLFINLVAASSTDNRELVTRLRESFNNGTYDNRIRERYYASYLEQNRERPLLERAIRFGSALLAQAGVQLADNEVLKHIQDSPVEVLPSTLAQDINAYLTQCRNRIVGHLNIQLGTAKRVQKQMDMQEVEQRMHDQAVAVLLGIFDPYLSSLSKQDAVKVVKPAYATSVARRLKIDQLRRKLALQNEDDGQQIEVIQPKTKLGVIADAVKDTYLLDGGPIEENSRITNHIKDFCKGWDGVARDRLQACVYEAFDRISEQAASETLWQGIKGMGFTVKVDGRDTTCYQYKPSDDRGKSYEGMGKARQKCRIRFVIVPEGVAFLEVADRDEVNMRDRNMSRGSARRK